jgi:hypothetical protein
MKYLKIPKIFIWISLLIFSYQSSNCQTKEDTISLMAPNNLKLYGVSVKPEKYKGKNSLRVELERGSKSGNEVTFAKLKNIDFKDGTINVFIAGKLSANAPEWARGFVGIAFRINEDNSKFECIYMRPTNAQSNDPIRRNRSTQYISHPDYQFDRLRKESPGKYESYADITPGEWMKVKIEIKGTLAKLYINNSKQPVLIVNDLKHGADLHGLIGLWIDNGTEAYFSNLEILH